MNHMSDEQLKNEFEKLGREWSEAIVSNDADAIGRFMANDWLIVGETGFTNKNDFLALVESGDLTHEAMDGSVQSVRGLR
jgi:hypothetical protein